MTKVMIFQSMYLMTNNPNPMIMLMAIITITMFNSALSFMTTLNYWMSILIIITYIGGLMIMFLYIISLMPNSSQKWSNLHKTTTTFVIIMTAWYSTSMVMMKSPLKTISLSYMNNLWNLSMITIMILMMAQMASKTILLPFSMMKSTY